MAEWVPRDVQVMGGQPHPVETGETLTRNILKREIHYDVDGNLSIGGFEFNVLGCIVGYR